MGLLITILPSTISSPTSGGAQIDQATAEWNGKTFAARSKRGVIPAIARALLAAGCPDQPWQAQRGSLTAMYGPSLARVAELTVTEPDHGHGPRFVKYIPLPTERLKC